MAKALAVIKKKPVNTLATREGQFIDLPANQVTVRKSGQLATKDKGQVVVAGSAERGEYGETNPSSSGRSQSSETTSKGGGRLVRVADAIAAGADPAEMEAKALSWGNKRARQKLADGGSIQRRVGGAGFGGSGSGGSLPPGRGSKKAATGKDTRTEEERFADIRKRSAAKPSGKAPSQPLPTGPKSRSQALDDRKRPLALGDKKPPTRSAGASGFITDDQASAAGREVGKNLGEMINERVNESGAPVAAASLVTGNLDLAKAIGTETRAMVKDTITTPLKTQVRAAKLHRADVAKEIKKGNWRAALDLVLSPNSKWHSAAEQNLAADALERALKKK